MRSTAEQDQEDRSIAQVEDYFTTAGWKVEWIRRDVGEDAFVRPFHCEQELGLPIQLQLKSVTDATARPRLDGSQALRLSVGHLLKWTRSLPPTLIVLWNVDTRHGWFALAHEAAATLDRERPDWRSQRTVTLRLAAADLLVPGKHTDLLARSLSFASHVLKDQPIRFVVQLGDSAEERALAVDLQRFFEDGDPVQIPARLLAQLELPPLLEALSEESDAALLAIGPGGAGKRVPTAIRFCGDNDDVEVRFVDLVVAKAGTKRVTLDNEQQRTAHRFTVVLSAGTESTSNFRYHPDWPPPDIDTWATVLEIRTLVSRGCTVEIEFFELGYTKRFSACLPDVEPDETELQVVADLNSVEANTACCFDIPLHWPLSQSDIRLARTCAAAFDHGKIHFAHNRDGAVQMGRAAATEFVASFEGEPLYVRSEIDCSTVKLLGVDVELPSAVLVSRVTPTGPLSPIDNDEPSSDVLVPVHVTESWFDFDPEVLAEVRGSSPSD